MRATISDKDNVAESSTGSAIVAEQLLGDFEVEERAEAPPANLYRELQAERVVGTRQWVQSASFHDDILVALDTIGSAEKLVEKQITLSSNKWEEAQQRAYAKTGARSFQLQEIYKGKDIEDYLAHIADRFWSDYFDNVLSNKTEAVQLLIFKMYVKGGAVAYEDIHCITRKPPYSTSMITVDDEVRADLQATPACVLDLYTGDVREVYGSLDSPFALGEVNAINATTQTDQSLVERLHQVRQRKQVMRGWTNALSAETVGAWAFGDWVKAKTNPSDPDDAASEQPDNVGCAQSSRGLSLGAWAFRAFQHLENHGAFYDAAINADIGARWKNMSEEQKLPFFELGRQALELHQVGLPAFDRSDRKRRRSCSPEPADVGDEAQQIDSCGIDVDPSLRVLPRRLPRLRGTGVSVAKVDANIVKLAHLDRQVRALELQDAIDIKEHRAVHAIDDVPSVVPDMAESCGISRLTTGDENLGEKTFHAQGQSYDFGSVGALQSSSKKVVMDALVDLEERGASVHARKWCGRMSVVRHVECKELGAVDNPRRLCHEAGMCLCNDDGERLINFLRRLNIVHGKGKGQLTSKRHKALMDDAAIVLHFRACFMRPRPGAPAGVPDVQEVWTSKYFNVAKLHNQPWKPTYLELARRPDGDRPGCLGVTALKGLVGETLAWVRMWELAQHYVRSTQLDITWYELYADSRRVVEVVPAHQRIRRLEQVATVRKIILFLRSA